MSDFDKPDKGLQPNQRWGGDNLNSEVPQKFPFEAFETDDVNGVNPIITVKNPWIFAGTLHQSLTLYSTVSIASANTVISLDNTWPLNTPRTYAFSGGDGSNTLTFDNGSSETINGNDAAIWIGQGMGSLTLLRTASVTWIVVNTGIWDTYNIVDDGANINRTLLKFVDGSGFIKGVYNPGTYNVNTAWGTLWRSAAFTATLGITTNSTGTAKVNITGSGSNLGIVVYNPTTILFNFQSWFISSLTNRTDDYPWEVDITWK